MTGLLTRSSRFDTRPAHLGFVMDKVELGHVSSGFCGFPPVTVIPPVLHTHSLVTDTVASNLGTTLFISTATRHIVALWLPGNSHTPVTCDLPAMLQILRSPNPQRESHIRYKINLLHLGYVARTEYSLCSTPTSVK